MIDKALDTCFVILAEGVLSSVSRTATGSCFYVIILIAEFYQAGEPEPFWILDLHLSIGGL